MAARRYVPYLGLALALLVSLALQTFHFFRSPIIGADGINFVYIARELPQGAVEAFRKHDQHPGFPAMVLACTSVVHALGFRAEPESWMIGARVVTLIFGLLSVVVVWLMTRDLFDTRVAGLAACVFAVLPLPNCETAAGQSDIPHLFFYLLAAWLATSAISPSRPWRLAGAGAAAGIAYWIRPEGLEVALVACAAMMLRGLVDHWSWRRWGLAGAALALPAMAIVAPYAIAAGKVTSKQHPVDKFESLVRHLSEPSAAPTPASAPQGAAALPTAPVASQVAAPTRGTESPPVAATVRATPSPPVGPRSVAAEAMVSLGKAIARFVACICQGLRWIFIPWLLVGMVVCVRRRPRWPEFWFLAALAGLHIAILLSVHIGAGYLAQRHVLPVVGLAMPATALGIIFVGEKLAAVARIRATYSVLGVLGLSFAVAVPYTLRPFNREFLPVIAATRWVQARAEQRSAILCNSPYVDFFTTLPTLELDQEVPTVEAALAQAKSDSRCDYVVLHVGAHGYRPEWIGQLEPYYRPVRLFPDPTSASNSRKVLIFESRRIHASRPPRDSRF